MTHRILVVEDDQDIGSLLQDSLTRVGYEVLRAQDGRRAVELVNDSLDLVILDIMMPGISGIETCKQIRETSNVPILFLTARSSTLDKTEGLLAGGDDYMTKPFSEDELHARVIAQLRRYTIYKEKQEPEEMFLVGGKLRVNEEFNEVWKEGRQIMLSDLEYRILKLLMSKRNKIFLPKIYMKVCGVSPTFTVPTIQSWCISGSCAPKLRRIRHIQHTFKRNGEEAIDLLHRKFSLTNKLAMLIFAAAIVSGVFFLSAQKITNELIDRYLSSDEYYQEESAKYIQKFSRYVSVNELATSDRKAFEAWVKKKTILPSPYRRTRFCNITPIILLKTNRLMERNG